MPDEPEPLTAVLLRLWSDTLTVREADPVDVEIARQTVLAELDLDIEARKMERARMQAELRDTRLYLDLLRDALARKDADDEA